MGDETGMTLPGGKACWRRWGQRHENVINEARRQLHIPSLNGVPLPLRLWSGLPSTNPPRNHIFCSGHLLCKPRSDSSYFVLEQRDSFLSCLSGLSQIFKLKKTRSLELKIARVETASDCRGEKYAHTRDRQFLAAQSNPEWKVGREKPLYT